MNSEFTFLILMNRRGDMSRIQKKRSVAIVSFLSIGVFVLSFCGPHAACADNPDIPHIEAGAERGSIRQEIELGNAYLLGRGVARDEKQAAYWYEKAANSGDPVAQEQIGYFYEVGFGVTRDPSRAAQWFERAVAGGLISAKVNLGIAYLRGNGVRKDPIFAAQLFREAAQKGSGFGACYLGNLYFSGIGVTKSPSDAVHWFELGSRLHNPPAEFDLALLLIQRSDLAGHRRAIKLLRESAAAGYVAAKHWLGIQLIQGPDPSRSPNEGIALLEEAAAAGFWRSSMALGILSRDGDGTAKNSSAAYYHFRITVLQAGEQASSLLTNDLRALSSELNHAQLEALDQRAEAWAERHKRSLEYVKIHDEYANRDSHSVAPEYPEKDTRAVLLPGVSDPDKTQGDEDSPLESIRDE
jgi:TPR repeat protein